MERILYLYREIMPYNIPVLEELTKKGFDITIVHYTREKLTPYLPPNLKNMTFISYEQFTRRRLLKMAVSLNPCLVYVSGWSNPDYNYTTTRLRNRMKIPVIVGSDTQWKGGRQWLNVLSSWFRHKRYFSHILVAGMRQFEYAKRIGFSNDRILWPLLSANTEIFRKILLSKDRFDHPRNFLYVGRFANVKGLEILLNAWVKVQEKNGATLTLVGNGPLKNKLNYPGDVVVHEFMNQEDLAKLAGNSSCFVLPSVFEPWALVIHEFAAAGLPLIVTDACGAAPHFVINHYNGFVVKPNSVIELKTSIESIIHLPNEILFEYSRRSRQISKSITPEMAACAITSVLQ